MKHAYLILAHTDFNLLEKLIFALDDIRNDIYIHFDKKTQTIPTLKTNYSKLYILKNRIKVYWGDVSVVEAEYALFEEASHNGHYYYYHLLSGADLPLKSQNYIHHFFYEKQGLEFIGFSTYDYKAEVYRKVNYYHLFPRDFHSRNFFIKLFRAIFLRMQFVLCIRRNKNINFKKGTQWVSVTNDFVSYIISKKKEVLNTYHHTFCSDEIFVQTLCWNSSFRKRVYDNTDEGHGCVRMIGWTNNQIKKWEEKDYDKLMQSDALFARKFCSKHIELVDRILKTTLS
jgi:hypothetical protein